MKTRINRIIFCIVVMILLLSMLVACSSDIKGKDNKNTLEYNYISYTMNNGQTWVKYKIVDYTIFDNGNIAFETEQGEKLMIHCGSWVLYNE